MAEKLNVRLINKHGTYSEWQSSNLILKEGEIALAKFTTPTADAKGNIVHVPTYLMKVGDGTNKFSALTWLSAPASDVYSWAKSESIDDVSLASHPAIVALNAAIDGMNVTDTGTGFVTAVVQTDGKISVTKRAITKADISGILSGYVETGTFDDLKGRVAALEARMTDLDGVMAAVTGAMHFVGITTTDPAKSGATVTGVTSFKKGDVVVYKVAASGSGENAVPAHDIEYVNVAGGNDKTAWVELGDVTAEQQQLSAHESAINLLNAAKHTHANKAVLDTITADNVHTHSNKTVIDGITSTKVSAWDTIAAKKEQVDADNARVDALYNYFTADGKTLPTTLILDCGGPT